MSITDLSLLFSTLYKSLNVGKEPNPIAVATGLGRLNRLICLDYFLDLSLGF
jgi:hypothetical protein